MGKLVLLALTTIDGCISNLEGIKEWGLKWDIYGVTKIYDEADTFITERMGAETVAIIRESIDGYCLYVPEAGMEDFTRQIIEHGLVDELYLYVFSYTVGAGIPLFSHNIGTSNYWELEEAKVYNKEIVRLHYSRVDIMENGNQKLSASDDNF